MKVFNLLINLHIPIHSCRNFPWMTKRYAKHFLLLTLRSSISSIQVRTTPRHTSSLLTYHRSNKATQSRISYCMKGNHVTLFVFVTSHHGGVAVRPSPIYIYSNWGFWWSIHIIMTFASLICALHQMDAVDIFWRLPNVSRPCRVQGKMLYIGQQTHNDQWKRSMGKQKQHPICHWSTTCKTVAAGVKNVTAI